MSKKHIYILYQLVCSEIERIESTKYEWTNPTCTTERVYTINDNTRRGYYETMAIENVTGVQIPRSGTLFTRELSYDESCLVHERNQREFDRMYSNQSLYEDLTEIKQTLEKLSK